MKQTISPEVSTNQKAGMTRVPPLVLLAFVLGIILSVNGAAWASSVVLTPFGQSPDAMMVKVVLKKIGVNSRLDKVLTAEELKDEKALIVVVGGSSKGMGAAGINKDEEITRVKDLIAKARKNGTKVLVMHIGGKGRRGKLSDQFISEAVPLADQIIIVEGGDHDGLVTGLLKDKNIDIMTAPNVRGCGDPLKTVLSGWHLL